MFAYKAGRGPANNYRAFAARAAAAALIAALGGCASDQYQSAAGYAPAEPRVAQVVVDVEADGIPAQTPPPFGARQLPDDPTEPYSRNYGGANPSAMGPPGAKAAVQHHENSPRIPDDLPPAFRQKLVTAMTAYE